LNILIIGFGNIGYRHFQGLCLVNTKIKITVFDIDINTFKKIDALLISKNIKILKTTKAPKKQKFDLVISASTNFKRYMVMKNLINNNTIRYIILEKIAFESPAQYFNFYNLLSKKKSIQCFINYNRNMMKSYIDLKKKIKNKQINYISVIGSNWNLVSNSLHFINLFLYLFEKKDFSFIEHKLHKKIYLSKRKGFSQLKGKIIFQLTDIKIVLEDNLKNKSSLITLKSINEKIVIDESNQKIIYHDLKKNKSTIKKFKINLVSQQSKEIYSQILNKKPILLPKYKTSFKFDIFFCKLISRITKKELFFHNFKFT
jgi:hypothetical protein